MILKLYHGSTQDFGQVDINRGRGYKDFGKGFYASVATKSAESFVRRKADTEAKWRGISQMYIDKYVYALEFDTDVTTRCNYKRFDRVDEEWLDFIIANRNSRTRAHRYDIVSGPTADDKTLAEIKKYMESPDYVRESKEVRKALIRTLNNRNNPLPEQWYFGNNAVAQRSLKIVSRRII